MCGFVKGRLGCKQRRARANLPQRGITRGITPGRCDCEQWLRRRRRREVRTSSGDGGLTTYRGDTWVRGYIQLGTSESPLPLLVLDRLGQMSESPRPPVGLRAGADVGLRRGSCSNSRAQGRAGLGASRTPQHQQGGSKAWTSEQGRLGGTGYMRVPLGVFASHCFALCQLHWERAVG